MKRKVKKQKLSKLIIFGGILLGGLAIFNFKSLFATQEDMILSVDRMSNYIVAELEKQGNLADLSSICKDAKKLDETGLKLVVSYNDGEKIVNFYKEYEQPILIKELKLK